MSSSMLSLSLFVLCLYLMNKETLGSGVMSHPQKMFCDADYVFRFKAMSMNAGRTKRGLGLGRFMRKPRTQMVKIERFYKGEKMMKSMMEEKSPVDLLSAAEKMEASLRLDLAQRRFKKNEKCIFFGKMYRYSNRTIMPANEQVMLAGMTNTLPASTVTKFIKRGLRRKYAKGCKTGCSVITVFSEVNRRSKRACYWNMNKFHRYQEDCRKTQQFCYKGKDGYCKWRVTRSYKKCMAKNRWP